MSFTTYNRDSQRQPALAPSLLAVCIAMAFIPASGFAANEDTVIVDGSATADSASGEEQDYSVKSTTAGTKMQMTQRDIPQSVTIVSQQRMEDQQLQTLGDVMDNTLGISKSQADSDRNSYFSRGFEIDNYMVDGIPTYFESRWNLGDALSDTALFERVEVVRGANGLMTGTGNPSASINMIRKHATSREFTGNVSAEYGSWNKQRYVTDLQSPLTEDGNVRARIVAGYQNNDSGLTATTAKKCSSPGLSMRIWVTPPACLPVMNTSVLTLTAQPGVACRAGIPTAAKTAMIVHAARLRTGPTMTKTSTKSLSR